MVMELRDLQLMSGLAFKLLCIRTFLFITVDFLELPVSLM